MASAIDPDPTNFVVPVRALPIEARKYIPRIVTVFFFRKHRRNLEVGIDYIMTTVN